ncbi:hypothetical protein [Allostreptomyces psammosilenae]|uniref:Uncharacterized protein n=1 Tax=Allostreptomyces psammosilenae TaxID=1892865 RepID=A0A853A1F3_9ACTN|nr:hypothetical protein [Allostreptomyces psammosilenae]NYI07280.1 hypothetical protein [Allostreptomyces psammosilenae]
MRIGERVVDVDHAREGFYAGTDEHGHALVRPPDGGSPWATRPAALKPALIEINDAQRTADEARARLLARVIEANRRSRGEIL